MGGTLLKRLKFEDDLIDATVDIFSWETWLWRLRVFVNLKIKKTGETVYADFDAGEFSEYKGNEKYKEFVRKLIDLAIISAIDSSYYKKENLRLIEMELGLRDEMMDEKKKLLKTIAACLFSISRGYPFYEYREDFARDYLEHTNLTEEEKEYILSHIKKISEALKEAAEKGDEEFLRKYIPEIALEID
ncbi:MAG: hypothetical protein ACTSX9_03940 [Candidatus Njordarchaeales archaeon]